MLTAVVCLLTLLPWDVAAVPPKALFLQAGEIATHTRSAWDAYRGYILGALAVLIFQSILIAALLLLRSRGRELVARNSAILSAIPDLMFVLTREGVYVDFSAPEGAHVPVDPKTFLGKRMRDVVPIQLASQLEELFSRLTLGEPPALIEYSLPLPGGTRDYEARFVLLENNHVFGIVRDITERRRSDAALHEARLELARASRLSALGEFAGTISHEIRQPLTAIVMNAKSCLRGLSTDNPDLAEITAGLLDIVEASQRAEDVIQHNRRLFRDHVVERTPLDINDIIRESVTLMAPRLRDNHVQVDTTLGGDLPRVNGDRIELEQVLVNLISNAVDALETVEPAARHIEVTSSMPADDQTVVVTVKDNGTGFHGVESQQLFALSYTTKPNGSGVGLAVSRSIVEAHGGQLWAEKNPAGGATFQFSVPSDAAVVKREKNPSPHGIT